MTTALRPYPWQQGLWDSLCRLAQDRRLPHALLLAAPEGMGKQRFARAFSAWRLCQQPVADQASGREGACGECRSCQLLAAGSHPDLLWVSPETDGEKVSKVIKIEQARAVVDFANQAAQLQGYRIVVLDPAHALNTASANALLKTLEEPGRDSLFLLLTDQPAALLATIRSRCQLLPLSVPAPEVALDWLRGELADAASAAILLGLARGAPLAAAQLADSAWFKARSELLADLTAVAAGELAPLTAAGRWQKMDAGEQVTAWQSLLDDATQLAMAPDELPRHHDLRAGLERLTATLAAQTLLEALWQAVEARRLLDTNVQPQSILETLWLHWGRETRKRPAGGHHAG
ncbi:DNA polymerase III subunit delta' [Amnimonas aquatica]|uniref:DNA polymerase III subunit delta' n=1 Tax=Amnimonas aquatica TaxID=2094561 RepID=A0A2P6AUQ9_9GAMM|nr:DNA polymerase III subunit delta' [Amnimonas aquatica]PQA50901.1 DNA polymerase III subunit delta' [Amnimonas aquatica]